MRRGDPEAQRSGTDLSWRTLQHRPDQELVPLDFHQMTTATEALEASRIQREEFKAKSLSSRPWEKKPEWEKRSEEPKGKGKTKDEGKLKGKGDRQAQGGVSKEDREKK